MVDQGIPVSEPFDPLQELHEPGVVEVLQAAALDQLQQMPETRLERVQRRINRVRTPEIHTHMVLEHSFDSK